MIYIYEYIISMVFLTIVFLFINRKHKDRRNIKAYKQCFLIESVFICGILLIKFILSLVNITIYDIPCTLYTVATTFAVTGIVRDIELYKI